MRLLDGLAKATAGEVHLPTETLGVVITKPVLEQGSAVYLSVCGVDDL